MGIEWQADAAREEVALPRLRKLAEGTSASAEKQHLQLVRPERTVRCSTAPEESRRTLTAAAAKRVRTGSRESSHIPMLLS
jgi:hypothetical protein